MKKIIIIDNSSVVTSLFKNTISKALSMEVFVSKTIEEAKALLEKHTFFMAITNLYMVGANQSENLDLLASQGIPTIVFSSQIESKLLEKGEYPNIIDYVFKDTSGLDYIVRLIETIEYCSCKKALVVDDSNTTAKITKKMLQKISLHVLIANDGHAALEVLKAHDDVALVVSDYHMPTLNGLEFVKKFRSDLKNSAIPVLITTSNRDENTKIALYKHGINDLIQKPVLEEELKFKLINLFLDKKHHEESLSQKQTIENYVITSATDTSGTIVSVSEALCYISGYSKEDLIGKNHNILKHPDMPDAVYQDMWCTITSGFVWRGEVKNRKKNGEHYWVDAIIEPVFDNENAIKGYYAIRLDITDKKTIEEISITDGLTNIFNRRHFNDTFPTLISNSKKDDALVCFLLMDIDHFKQYNDNYGHQMGDDVLIKFAACLRETLGNAGTPFRLGGEEFGITYKAETKEKAIAFANRVKEEIEDLKIAHEYSSASKYITASMGLVCRQASQIEHIDAIYKETDDLLYVSKEGGRNKVTVNADGTHREAKKNE